MMVPQADCIVTVVILRLAVSEVRTSVVLLFHLTRLTS